MAELILALHAGANSSAAIGYAGRLQYCIQEERLSGIKGHMGFPHGAIAACLRHVGANPADVAEVAYGSLSGSVEHCPPDEFRRRLRGFHGRTEAGRHSGSPAHDAVVTQAQVRAELARAGTTAPVFFHDHHTTHAATAYYGLRSEPDRPYLVLTCDGFGDGACATVSIWRSGEQEEVSRSDMRDSLGLLYFWVTHEYGFVPHSDEYKLMGMAPYADAHRAGEVADVFRRWLGVDRARLALARTEGYSIEREWPRVADALRGRRFDDVFGGLQAFTEALLAQWVSAAVDVTGIRDVLVAGGVFMNVKANQRIAALSEVESFAAFPSCGDESLPIGAFYLASARQVGHRRVESMSDCYLGDDITDQEATAALAGTDYRKARPVDVSVAVAALLADGQIVARAAGRMEFGARALGNRSILADPADADLPRVLNRLIKRRDFWMPFAPAVLASHQHRYLHNPRGRSSPNMTMTFGVRPEAVKHMIAAVHPADLTCRAQIVQDDAGCGLARILARYREQSGAGVLLNTSLNLHGQPIARTADDALRVFAESGLEHLQLGPYLLSKRTAVARHQTTGGSTS